MNDNNDAICICCGKPITPEYAYSPAKDFCRRPACVKTRIGHGIGEASSVLDDIAQTGNYGIVPVPSDLSDENNVASFIRARWGLAKASDKPSPSRYIVKPDPKLEPPAFREQIKLQKKRPADDLCARIRNAMINNWYASAKHAEKDSDEIEESKYTIPAYRQGEAEPEVVTNEALLEWYRYCTAFDARRELGLTLQDLADWIRHPDFKKLIVEDVIVERYKVRLDTLRAQYRLNNLVPPSNDILRKIDRHVPVPVVKTTTKRALKNKERAMYLDLADLSDSKLSPEQMLEKHGTWSDAQIRELETKIIRHAIDVGLYELPSHDREDHEEVEPTDDAIRRRLSALFDTVGKGREAKAAGLSVHQTRSDFDRGLTLEGAKLTPAEKYAQRMGPPEGTDGDDF